MGKPLNKVSLAGILVTFGIIFGDIGTSPLYVFSAIVHGKPISEALILGGLSCVIWTLTLQTTIKYVILTLKADNKGEGGMFSLYALVRKYRKSWVFIPAMVGGAAVLAESIITPPISVTSAIEGLRTFPSMSDLPQSTIVIIVLIIISVLFFLQQFGTASLGKLFGPVMVIWFLMLAITGSAHIMDNASIIKAFNPYYGYKLLVEYPKGFWILGAVFLCTTGAEALYSDLGHCGRQNIRVSWIFVKICLLLNYIGQGSWLLNQEGTVLGPTTSPFFNLMPEWFLPVGIIIATFATIVASQALISGAFTLISEATKLNLWPKLKINYPTEEKGQLYIPSVNTFLFIGCCAVVLYFQKASNMEAAYGLTITLGMLMNTTLFSIYLASRRRPAIIIYFYLAVYLTIEFSFMVANLDKFTHGGFVSFILGGLLFFAMYDWYRARKIKNRYVEFVKIDHYLPQIQTLSIDKTIPKYATHLVYMSSANNVKEIEHKVIYSILDKKPKRANIYWFVHIDVTDDPYTKEFKVTHIMPNEVIRIDFRLGFRVEQKINLMFKKVMDELIENNEIYISKKYDATGDKKSVGDIQFIVLEKYLSLDTELPFWERIIMKFYFWMKEMSLSEERGFGLDPSSVTVEKYPLIVAPVKKLELTRVYGE